MKARPLTFFILAIIFLAAHLTALELRLYWYLPWYDIMMHTWGGYLVIFGFLMLGKIGSRRLALPHLLLFPALVGVMAAWEIFEYAYGIAGEHPSYLVDTVLDFVWGTIGGIVAYVTTKKH
ncbi:hypothetical protein K2Q16_03445 [Patescibacteria group bacterium]|nr:hypothetical protein [Patescibacteria group bacterium]